ncbi:hypothetical protein SAMN04489716_5611 [Actinoplanes derwentensis]|uniref:Uncharacterized protein n=1 Tax=Actinoplanes derwentensis TaxID=113562 RepID=A0A1H2CCY7_9ACTN|nr:hypothetical protein SAMN04489716_5611 [Actinoplanes derwentensis]
MDRVGAGCHPVPVTPHDDHSQQRQPLFIPVVITTVLLTIIGMVGGYLLAEKRAGNAPEPRPEAEPTISLLPAGQLCLERTQKMGRQFGADGELRQVLRVRTKKRTVVWICQDESGELFYHANKGGADAEWVENKTALFLDKVSHDGAGTFSATTPTDRTTFTVNSERLVIAHTDGRVEEQDVVPE